MTVNIKTAGKILGKMLVGGGYVAVTDPCYLSDGHDVVPGLTTSIKVPDGEWVASIDISDEGSWGDRVAALTIRLNGAVAKNGPKLIDWLRVDSGQMMFLSGDAVPIWVDGDFSLTSSPDGREFPFALNEQHVNALTYNGACLATLQSEDKAGMLADKAVVSSSGYGDGQYPLYAWEDGIGRTTMLSVAFIEDDEEDEDEDVEEEDE